MGYLLVEEGVSFMGNEELEYKWVRLDNWVKTQNKDLVNHQHLDKRWYDKQNFGAFRNQSLRRQTYILFCHSEEWKKDGVNKQKENVHSLCAVQWF